MLVCSRFANTLPRRGRPSPGNRRGPLPCLKEVPPDSFADSVPGVAKKGEFVAQNLDSDPSSLYGSAVCSFKLHEQIIHRATLIDEPCGQDYLVIALQGDDAPAENGMQKSRLAHLVWDERAHENGLFAIKQSLMCD